MDKLIITELELSGFKRLALSDTKYIKINPQTNVHLMLGTNGSGKSSIMDLLTPLPPDRSDFEEGGFKRILFKYDSDNYEMYSEDNKHSIYKNNEPIIESTGIKNMLEFCKSLFNITPTLNNFLLNKTKFTSMSALDRKDFITSISNVDFDYVNKLYVNIKKRLRDVQAINKHLNNKLLSLKEYILSEKEISELKETEDRLKNVIYQLFENKVTITNNKEVGRVVNVDKNISKLIDSLSELNLSIDKLESEHAISKSKLKENQLQIESIEIEIMKLTDVLGVEDINDRLRVIRDRRKELNRSRILDTNIDIDYLKNMTTMLLDKVMEMSNLYVTPSTIDSTMSLYNTNTNRLSTYDNELQSIYDLKRVYKESTNILTCPKCHTHFDDTIMFDSISKLDIRITELIELKKPILKENIELKEQVKSIDEFLTVQSRVKTLLINSKLEQYVNTEDMKEIVRIVTQLKRDVFNTSELLQLDKDEVDLNKQLESNIDTSMFSGLQSKHDELLAINAQLKNSNNRLSTVLNLNNSINSDIDKVQYYLNNYEYNRKNEINKIKNTSIDKLISIIKEELVIIGGKLDKFNYMMVEEQGITKEIEESELDIELLGILINELNPNTGLIGDSIKSFLGVYINEVNDIINKVWSYPLEVQPLEDNDKGITYKFPVFIKGEPNTKDISLTSESMSEIINLAFRLVSLKYMGMEGFPLMIDEFGKSMDEVHLIKAYDMLERISDNNDSQMYIIAHIKACYNRFNNAGMTIVSGLNMEISE